MDTISFVYRQFIDVDILFGYIARNASFWDVEILFGPFLLRLRNYTCSGLYGWQLADVGGG